MNNDFFNKLEYFKNYAKDYDSITFFEITQKFGSNLFALMVLLISPLLFFYSFEWPVLILASFCMMCMTWYFFDIKVPLPDFLKAKSISSDKVITVTTKATNWIGSWQKWAGSQEGTQEVFSAFWNIFRAINVSLIALLALIIGFMSPTSMLPVFSLIVLTFGLLIEDGYFSLAGYVLVFVFFIKIL